MQIYLKTPLIYMNLNLIKYLYYSTAMVPSDSSDL